MKVFQKVLGCGAIATALAIGTSATQAQVVNGSFEANTTTPDPISYSGIQQGWSDSFGGGAFTQTAAQAHTGTYSLLAQNAPGNAWNPQGSYQIIYANDSVGNAWSASVWAMTDTGTGTSAVAGTGPVDFQINFLDGALGNVGQVETGWVAIDALDTWQQYSVGGFVPAGAQYMSIYTMAMIGPGGTDPVNVYFDDVVVTGIPEPTTFALAGMGAAALLIFRRRS